MGRIGKKVLSWTLCLMMAIGMLPGMTKKANAADSEYIIDMSAVSEDLIVNSTTSEGKLVVVVGSSRDYNLTIEAAKNEEVKVVFSGVSIDVSKKTDKPAILVQGEGRVTIQLVGDNTVKGAENCAGIQKSDNVALTITSSENGKLTATGGKYGAGIGGGNGEDGSNITISGEVQVTATGGERGAGIGGGLNSNGEGIKITISGDAQVMAKGGWKGAGIGGGLKGNGEGINITIRDNAQVTATGGERGAGIGGGSDGYGFGITISGDGNAQVTATGGDHGAGIGGGHGSAGSEINITISGDGNAQVTATGGDHGAGIGGGHYGSGSGITISGDGNAQVTATGGPSGAGIGGGYYGYGSGITISGNGKAQVTATGGDFGAGIGGGDHGEGSDITISGKGNAQVTATGGEYGAGIGGGYGCVGSNITISGGTVTATGGFYGAGIGGGVEGAGSGITISGNALVTSIGGTWGAGIGGGDDGEGSDITISGNAQVTATGGDFGAGIGGGCGGEGSGIKVYDNAIVSVSGGKSYNNYGSGAGVGSGGKYDSNGNPPEGNETVITFTDDDHKTFNGNVLYYEKGSSAESIEKWEATRINFVTISLKANDGTDMFSEQIVSVGVPTNLQENSFTRKGHSFTGWNTQADGKGTPYEDQTQRIWEPNTILYAQWHKHVYDQTVADETKYLKSAATCTKAAVYYKSCACSAFDPEESGTFESGEALRHDYKDVAGTAKKATCTEEGREADQECSRCHDVITGEEIARLAHTFDQEVATDKYLKTPEDCTHKAVYYKSCVCGEPGAETFEYGEALGHDYKDVAGTAKAATCKETGKEADKKCENCGDVITGAVIAKTTDHKWKAATGYNPKTCEVCGATEGSVIKYDSETGKTLEHTQGDNKDETITFHRSEDDKNAIDHLKGVQIDGEYVNPAIRSGSVIITFDAATLNKLSVGDHVITVIFDDWKDELKLVIKAPVVAAVDTSPITGDSSMPILWVMLILMSMAGASVVMMRRRKRA